ncbi:MAG: DNA translocase FtsK 4TM domain-containing protein [bacterium]|nr:DNA translocase FtsK 4TM domain-containing protein [bacterium]
MAKRKKRKSRKVEEKEPNLFWRQATAVLLFLAAIFLLLGGFGAGGPLPQNLFGSVYWAFGYAAWLAPVALVYFGVLKFQTEDHKVPFSNKLSMVFLLSFLASWLHVGFADKQPAGEYIGGLGGKIGEFMGSLVLNALDPLPAAVLFLVLTMLALFFSFGISPIILGGIVKIFKRKERDDEEENMAILAVAAKRKFMINEGVPIEHHRRGALGSSLKNSVPAKLEAKEDHAALTTASDPNWKFPGLNLLSQKQDKADPGDTESIANSIQEAFGHFDINVEMEGANIGPRITQYTLRPPAGVKLNKISSLDDNIALTLGAQTIRIEAPIPGKKLVGIEVPNVKPASVIVSSILESSEWKSATSPLSLAIGKDIAGAAVVGELDEMPHILIAGQTKSGKSVMINTLLTSLLYRNSPSDLKLILVDPKQVELAPYADIPHLLTPVITESEKTISALKWAVAEMERRYRTLAENKKRNIADYNAIMKEEGMPYIVIVIDEMADLMMAAGRDVEALIVRIAQKARAVGIHLVLATQSPRANVITGLIKANIPARIAFTVAQELESRIIMDSGGAEKLLGRGDMLYQTTDMPKPKRIQGAFISTEETNAVMDFLRMQRPPQYDDEVVSQPVQLNGKGGLVADYSNDGGKGDEAELRDAVHVVLEARKASTSLLQRRLRIGYGKAARLIETMEEQGIIGTADGSRPREVLISSMDDVFGNQEVVPEDSEV